MGNIELVTIVLSKRPVVTIVLSKRPVVTIVLSKRPVVTIVLSKRPVVTEEQEEERNGDGREEDRPFCSVPSDLVLAGTPIAVLIT